MAVSTDQNTCLALQQLNSPIPLTGGYDNELILPDTGPSRCFAFWQELLGCYVVNGSEGVEGKKKCLFALEDYNECLHHSKEVCPLTKCRTLWPVENRHLRCHFSEH